MIYERLFIDGAFLTVYAPSALEENYKIQRPFMVICPGGGYEHVSKREGEPVALRFLSMGYVCAVLEYSVAPAVRYPVALSQLAESVKYLKNHCDKYGGDPARVYVMGFSAGGHLAGCLGTMWRDWGDECRPDAMVLCYPVISSGEYAHEGSFKNLLGDRYEELKDAMSLEKRVSLLTVPTFIWHTKTDKSVPYMNSVLFSQACDKLGVKNRLVLFSSGDHALSLADRTVLSSKYTKVLEEVAVWPKLVDNWINTL